MNGMLQQNRTVRSFHLGLVMAIGLGTQLAFAQTQPLRDGSQSNAFNDQLEQIKQSDEAARDAELLKLTQQQIAERQPIRALRALGMIRNPKLVRNGLQAFTDAAENESYGTSGTSVVSSGNRDAASGALPNGNAPQGGASFADFTQLVNLIQTTIEPDSWEALGGTGTIQQYPQGILVDGDGLVVDIQVADTKASATDALDSISLMLREQSPEDEAKADVAMSDWKQPAKFRCVSLRSLASEVVRRRLVNQPLDDSLRHLAGLSRIQYVWVDATNRDLVLVGPVSGIEKKQGWYCDRVTGETTARLDYLSATMQSVLANTPFGCTIDPTNDGLAASAKVADEFRQGKIPVSKIADALAQAVGKQQVAVFGTAGDTPLGHLLVEVDRHMKMLALGMQKMPEGVPNYLDVITDHARDGVPDGKLLRLWFTGSPVSVRTDVDQQVFEFAGRPMKLACESQLPRDNGMRAVAPDDVRLVDFTNQFNQHLAEIIHENPAYGAVQSVFSVAAVAETMRRTEAKQWIAELLGPLMLDGLDQSLYRTPRWVDTIATTHRFNFGGKRHTVVVASGGVQVDTRATLPTQFVSYPPLRSAPAKFTKPSIARDQEQPIVWWWNASDLDLHQQIEHFAGGRNHSCGCLERAIVRDQLDRLFIDVHTCDRHMLAL